MTLNDRHIPLKGAKNFRDFGGYATRCGSRVKRGKLFRADGLWRLSDEDLTTLSPLGIRSICDLRRRKEREMMPTRWDEKAAAKNLHLPLMPDEEPGALDQVRMRRRMESSGGARQVMIDVYRSMVEDERALSNLGRIFRIIASDDELPVLIHCSGGKDRTGVSCALILTLLGVDDGDVMEDYMHSQALYSDRINLERAATQVFDHKEAGDWDPEAVRPVYNVEPAYLESALNHVTEHYGEAENFVRQALGLTDAEIRRIRTALIE